MSLTHETQHAARALARLLEQLKPVAGLGAILNALNAQTQDLEDALWDVMNLRWLDAAEGEQLDVIGRLLKEPREGLGDEHYRERLRAKIRVLRSSGTAPNILKVFKLLLPDNELKFLSIGGANFLLDIGEIDASRLTTYLRFLRQSRSAGIGGGILYHLGSDGGDLSDAFTLSETDSTTSADTDKGFRPEPADGTGGKFSDVIS